MIWFIVWHTPVAVRKLAVGDRESKQGDSLGELCGLQERNNDALD